MDCANEKKHKCVAADMYRSRMEFYIEGHNLRNAALASVKKIAEGCQQLQRNEEAEHPTQFRQVA